MALVTHMYAVGILFIVMCKQNTYMKKKITLTFLDTSEKCKLQKKGAITKCINWTFALTFLKTNQGFCAVIYFVLWWVISFLYALFSEN